MNKEERKRVGRFLKMKWKKEKTNSEEDTLENRDGDGREENR